MSISKKDKYFRLLKQKQEKKELLDSYLRGGHRAPKSRREFLASGLLSFTGSLLAPTIPQLISSSAWAQEVECSESTDNSLPVFVHLQLAGGAALFANALPCKNNGAQFDNYARLGMGPQPNRANFFANNAPFWTQSSTSMGSPMFNQFFSVLTASNDMDIVNQAAFIQISAESIDDTANNAQDISGMLQAAGLAGSQLPYLSAAGTNRFKGAVLPSANLLRSNSVAAIEGSIQYSGALGSFDGGNNKVAEIHGVLAQLIENLNKYQVEQMARQPNSHESQKTFRNLIQCASQKNTSIQGQSPIVDIFASNYPGGNDLATVWNKNGVISNTLIDQVSHSIGACMSGMSPAAIIALGGYDYHVGRTRAQANAKDLETGDVLARILQSAKRRNKKIFVFISTDGSLNSPNDSGADETVNWTGDVANRSMGYILAYDPTGTVSTSGFNGGSYQDSSFQLNHFDPDYSVSNVNPMGAIDANDLYASAVFLNYLNFAGKANLIDKAELSAVKAKLESAVPSGVNIFDYFTRIKGVS